MVITIGGRYGSGGKRIAEKLAELLGYRLCDDEIIAEAVKNSGVDMKEETFRYFDESMGTGSVSEINTISSIQRSGFVGTVDSLSFDVMPMDRRLELALQEVLTSLADKGNCILMGRCADHYLAGRKDMLSVFVVDEEENCVKRIMEHFPELNEREARRLIKKTDKRREDYYSFFTRKSWGDVNNYAVTLNCALLGSADRAAELLAGMIRIA